MNWMYIKERKSRDWKSKVIISIYLILYFKKARRGQWRHRITVCGIIMNVLLQMQKIITTFSHVIIELYINCILVAIL
jgi:hypothetical protein